MTKAPKRISFQGSFGAYHEMAARAFCPDPALETVPCTSFEDTFRAVHEGKADLAVIAVDNTIAGRVADVHHLIPEGGLYIIGEVFVPIHHCLLTLPEARAEDLVHVHSHVHALPQCRKFIRAHGLTPNVHADTAGAARDVAAAGDPAHCAIASPLAAEIYGLKIMYENIADAENNVTRFLVMAPEPSLPPPDAAETVLTSFVFRVRNIPAALYKALGGFATNGVNMAKLESYVDGKFQAAQFYCDVEGHPDHPPLRRALEELDFFAREVRLLGTYPAHAFRRES